VAIAYCLHGFLGLPSDWDFLEPASPLELRKINVFQTLSPATGASMADWAQAFNAQVANETSESALRPRILVGYSMGGRLALHALLAQPELWDAAILISTNPGLPDGSTPERRERVIQDERWATRFESDTWDTVLADWDALPVFRWHGGGKPAVLQRPEADFTRADLAGALRSWSAGVQADLSGPLSRLQMPLGWVVGAEDTKYVEIAALLDGKVGTTFLRAGHRAPWENPSDFLRYFCGFLSRVLLETSR
jgi:2-succinyl-6-hydroxy-2,4-cyclohexadiene-1-carboxylate synthase